MEPCNKVLEFRQMVKFIIMKESLHVYILHHLKSYGTHVCHSNDMYICQDTPMKIFSNARIHIWQS
jgi:hypothetical protein